MDDKLKNNHHSRIYDNFLIHWKYVKREKIAGAKKGEPQWKYFYKDDKTDGKSKVNVATVKRPPSSTAISNVKNKIDNALGYDEKRAYETAKKEAAKQRHVESTAKMEKEHARYVAEKAQTNERTKADSLDKAKQTEKAAETAYQSSNTRVDRNRKKQAWEKATRERKNAEEEYSKAVAEKNAAFDKMDATHEVWKNAHLDRVYETDPKEAAAKAAWEDTALFKFNELSEKSKDRIDKGRAAVDELFDKIDSLVETPKEKREREAAEWEARREAVDAAAEEEYKRQEEERQRQDEERRRREAERDPVERENLKDLSLKEAEYTKDEDQAAINPNYRDGDEWQYNCAYCTAAYDLRQRGYDVEAMPCDFDTYDATLDSIPEWYEDTDRDDWIENEAVRWLIKDAYGTIDESKIPEVHENTKKTFEEMPDDSYGQFCVYWTSGGGHSMVWEKENGTTYIRDCQTNEKYTHDEWVSYYGDYAYGSYVLRTDNRTPSKEILKTVKNRDPVHDRRKRAIDAQIH